MKNNDENNLQMRKFCNTRSSDPNQTGLKTDAIDLQYSEMTTGA